MIEHDTSTNHGEDKNSKKYADVAYHAVWNGSLSKTANGKKRNSGSYSGANGSMPHYADAMNTERILHSKSSRTCCCTVIIALVLVVLLTNMTFYYETRYESLEGVRDNAQSNNNFYSALLKQPVTYVWQKYQAFSNGSFLAASAKTNFSPDDKKTLVPSTLLRYLVMKPLENNSMNNRGSDNVHAEESDPVNDDVNTEEVEEQQEETTTTSTITTVSSSAATSVTVQSTTPTYDFSSTLQNEATNQISTDAHQSNQHFSYSNGSTNTSSEEMFSNETVCKMPHLELNDPLIQPFLKDYAKLQCAKEKNWVYTEKGMFLITDHAVQQYGLDAINCTYVDLTRPHDETYEEHFYASFANGSQLMHEAFVADCFTETAKYRNVHIGVPYVPSLHQRKPVVASNGLDLNVYIYLLDSMSRVNFIRKLPKFYQLLTGEMNAVIMEGFNIVGDGTPWTMIPVTTGHFQTELYEARKRFENASYVDDWPLVFKDYENAGYITSYSEEQPAFSFFSYKLKGFEKPPVDHYLRVFQQAANYESSYHKPYCLGERAKSLVLCDWWKEQQDMYSPENIRTFSLLFSSETSHDDYNLVQTLDEHWETTFRQQYEAGYFNNTLLIVMGDHGRRFGAVRQTQSGKTEEKLPFLALVLPDWFRERYPNAWDNLKTNSKRLVNPFDIHATLMDALNFSEADEDFSKLTPRNISLFKKIPAGRTCAQAAIKAHFCACLDWENLETDKPDVKNAVAFALAKLNEANAEAGPGICATLRLNRTISARLLKPNENLLAFKESQDYDNIFPDLSDAANITAVLYQLRFVTAPNGGDYEVSLNYYANTGQFSLSFDDVSRLNMYGNQPHCILNTHQQLRQFCFCNDLLLRTNNSSSSKEANPEDVSNLGLVTLPEPDVIAVTDSTR